MQGIFVLDNLESFPLILEGRKGGREREERGIGGGIRERERKGGERENEGGGGWEREREKEGGRENEMVMHMTLYNSWWHQTLQ